MKGIAFLENARVYVTIEYDANKIIDSTYRGGKIVNLKKPITGAYNVTFIAKEGAGLDFVSGGCWEISLTDAMRSASDIITETIL